MSACRSACHRNNFRKSRVSDVSARILATKSVSVSASWNASLIVFAARNRKLKPIASRHPSVAAVYWRSILADKLIDGGFFGTRKTTLVCLYTKQQKKITAVKSFLHNHRPHRILSCMKSMPALSHRKLSGCLA